MNTQATAALTNTVATPRAINVRREVFGRAHTPSIEQTLARGRRQKKIHAPASNATATPSR